MNTGQVDTSIPLGVFESLQKAFIDFQERAERLSRAYASMQEDFKKINLELDRKNSELEQSLAKQEEVQTYLNSILESMDNGVIGIDIMGKITHFNRAASQITGYPPETIMNRHYAEIFRAGSTTVATGEPSLIQVLKTGKECKRDEKVLWHKDGHPVPVSFQTAPLRDSNGKNLGAVEIFTDISRIKALEEEMQQTKTMAALGEMSATVAHEIRNPLGAMGVWAGLLDRDLDPDDPRRKTLGRIIEGLSRLNKIVSNLLVYTRPIKADVRKVKLQDLLNEIVDFVQIEIGRFGQSITVFKKWEPGSETWVLADPEKMSQAVMNLSLNAIQAMPQGGTLTVSIETEGNEGSDFAGFAVIDTGTGIAEDDLSKIFDPFFTTKENGTGLGLAIVKKFVEYHSGHIDVRSKAGQGTAVRVFLPLLKE